MKITRKQKWEEIQLHRRFKWLVINISHEKIWTWLRKWNVKREIESLLIAAQNNAIRTYHIKARIDKMQQNSKCRLWDDRDKTINDIKSECCKLSQKNIRLDTTWWLKWSTGNCAKNWNLIIRTNDYIKPNISPGEWHTPTPLWFWYPNGSLNLGQTTRPYNN